MCSVPLRPRPSTVGLAAALLLLLICLSRGQALAGVVTPDESGAQGYAIKNDWRWVRSAVFVPTNCVNEAQQWDEYDSAIVDRELHYANFYGFNALRVFLHYDIYLKKKDDLLKNIEDFLARADKYKLKIDFVFFDDCWTQPDKAILDSNYKYPAPIYGVHNSRWLTCPGNEVKQDLSANADKLKAYVQDIVNAHKSDPRIFLWETYNEPNPSPETSRLMEMAEQWIHKTGTNIPLTATGNGKFPGAKYSDFFSYHNYERSYGGRYYSQLALNTECMNREVQSVPGVIAHAKNNNGFTIWELGIGRDNCRFPWQNKLSNAAKEEPITPFHGIIYPDGHPWSIGDAWALLGDDGFTRAPVFKVDYYKDDKFTELAKTSITPFIDFDLSDEKGTGSPDASAGIPESHFSIKWTGAILPPTTGEYTFYADCDDHVKVTINGNLLLNKDEAGRAEVSQKISLAGSTSCAVEIAYSHSTGKPSLHFDWSGPGLDKQVVLPVKNP